MRSMPMKIKMVRKMRITKTILGSAILTAAYLTSPAVAEEVAMPIAEQGNHQLDTPKNGLNKEKVESLYGAPMERIGAVGEPPISKWVYQDFTVYFENNVVLHSVRHRS